MADEDAPKSRDELMAILRESMAEERENRRRQFQRTTQAGPVINGAVGVPGAEFMAVPEEPTGTTEDPETADDLPSFEGTVCVDVDGVKTDKMATFYGTIEE